MGTGVCPTCGKRITYNNVYKSFAKIYEAIKIIPFCKECIWNTYIRYLDELGDEKKAIYVTCKVYNIPFSDTQAEGALKETHVKAKGTAEKFKTYMKSINSIAVHNGEMLDFDYLSDFYSMTGKSMKERKSINFERLGEQIEFTPEDKQTQQDVIRLLGYDPFAGYSKFDQKFLYGELLAYLDEDTLEDQYKLSQIIQILNNNNQIRKIDLLIASITSDVESLQENSTDVRSMSEVKNKIATVSNHIAKENAISVKNRKDSNLNKSTLTGLMKYLRDLEFEEVEVDFYDQKKAYGMKYTAEISINAIKDTLQFDENDINEIIGIQRELISNLEEKVLDLEEENRQLRVEINKSKS